MTRGFYSVVQYCPDRFRAEAVNVGLVLLSVEPHVVHVKMAASFDRAKKLFGLGRPDLKTLKVSVDGMKARIESLASELKTADDLSTFAASRANDLRLTEPRLAKLNNIDEDFGRLFSGLVEARSAAALSNESSADVLPPRLSEVFFRLQRDHRIWRPGTITVPIYQRKLDIPYAYKNGVVNLIKPHVFPASKRAETQAAEFAINGDLIQKHPIDGEQQRLIIVSAQETAKQADEINRHVEPLFREYGVRLIRPQSVDAFAREVEQSAH